MNKTTYDEKLVRLGTIRRLLKILNTCKKPQSGHACAVQHLTKSRDKLQMELCFPVEVAVL